MADGKPSRFSSANLRPAANTLLAAVAAVTAMRVAHFDLDQIAAAATEAAKVFGFGSVPAAAVAAWRMFRPVADQSADDESLKALAQRLALLQTQQEKP